jgi:hypothetical protein
MDAKEPLKLNILSEEQVSQTEESNRVPVYRVKNNQRALMGWAQRNDALRGVREIRVVEDNDVEVVYSKSDA